MPPGNGGVRRQEARAGTARGPASAPSWLGAGIRWARQQGLRHATPAGAPLRRERPARRRALARAAPAAARGRRAGGSAERREVVSARPHDEARPKVAGYPLHHARAGARDAGGRRPPARASGHPGPDRGGERGRGPGARVPCPRGALPAARARARPGAARRLRPGGEPRHRRARAARARARARRPAAHGVPLQGGPAARRAAGRAVADWRRRAGTTVLATSSATGQGVAELAAAIFAGVPADFAPAAGADSPSVATAGEVAAVHRVCRPGPARASTSNAPARASSRLRASGWSG